MKTSIYLTSDGVQIVCGKRAGKKQKIIHAFHPEYAQGAIINGVITNDTPIKEALVKALGRHRRLLKNVNLVIDSSLILAKQSNVPILPHKKLLEITRSELSEYAEGKQELLYDYAVFHNRLPDGQGASILCTAVEKSLVDSYVQLFSSAGIKLASVNLSLSAAVQLLHAQPELAHKTYIVCVLDGASVVSMLFVDGSYVFTNRNRLLGERGTVGIANEISRIVSSLVQFNFSFKRDQQVSDLYFCGLQSNEINECSAIGETFSMEAGPMPNFASISNGMKDLFDLADHFYVTANLMTL